MPDDFPADIRRFIKEHIESLAQLEALLLLRRELQRQWNAMEIAKVLYIPEELAAGLLTDFAKRGFVRVFSAGGAHYSYQTINTETDELIDRLSACYRERRVAMISLIYSKPMNKVQTFAEAFRLRKES